MRTTEHTPPGWTMEQALRETMLTHLPAEDRERLRQGGQALFNLAAGCLDGEITESCVAAELRAVLADLRYLQGYLGWISILPEEVVCTPDEGRLAGFAGQAAGQVAAIASTIERRLAEPPPRAS